MEDIKALIKKAKREEKKNLEFLYELGLRFKNGEGTPKDERMANTYFMKAGNKGHIKAQIESALIWWKYHKSYSTAKFYFSMAVEQGDETAKTLLAQMELEKVEKDSDGLYHCAKKGDALFEAPRFKDDPVTAFIKNHTFISCPACRGKLEQFHAESDGTLIENVRNEYDDGSVEECLEPSKDGASVYQAFECRKCSFRFLKGMNTTVYRNEKDNGTLWKRVEIQYRAISEDVGDDILKLLKKTSGKDDFKC